MTKRLLVIMDDISTIKTAKDSTFAMLLEAQARNYKVYYCQLRDLDIEDGIACASCQSIRVKDQARDFHEFTSTVERVQLNSFDIILMRKDPPFDMIYVYATYLLQHAADNGVLVVNNPQALRDANEKMYITHFPDLCPATLVSMSHQQVKTFVKEKGTAVLKPLDSMGGSSIFKTYSDDPNLNVILETLMQNGRKPVMAQEFIPDISEGDKRVLVVDGEIVPYMLARIPSSEDFRGNLAQGGRGVPMPVGDRERKIIDRLSPDLRRRGILFAGIDVIGGHITEINITSPTCIRELDKEFGCNIAGTLFDALERKLQ